MRLIALFAIAGFACAQAPTYNAIATSKQIMAGIQKPAMDNLSAFMKAGGPKDDKEWEAAAQHAAMLAESAQLLLLGSRPLDQDLWLKTSQRLQTAAADSAKAAQAKDVAAWKASIGGIGRECRGCHNVHRKRDQPAQAPAQ